MNTHYLKCQVQKGFTLVELLIVVIILAILAAIVVPQFATTTDDARITALDTNLSNMRAAIDLYRQQHMAFPGELTAVPDVANPCSGTPGTGAGRTEQTYKDQMTMYTNMAGMACSVRDPGYDFGPYLKKEELPDNPVTSNNVLAVVFAGDLDMSAPGPNGGWRYDTLTGKFIADDSSLDPNGDPYDTH